MSGTIAEHLARAEITITPFDLDAPFGPGILCFEEFSPALLRFVQEVSRGGIERVLVIALTAKALPPQVGWRLLHAGASDVLVWDELVDPVDIIAARLERWRAVDELVGSPLVQSNLVGFSPAWISLLRQLVEVAYFTDAAVLLTGETGTGKELAARLIHSLDRKRRTRELIVLDCTTIVPELSGSEMFGHERGAFTGAIAARDGAFAMADGGTLFLDEAGELPLGLQPQLLRVLQEHTYKRIGSNQWRTTDFRLVCATNRDLVQAQASEQFRRDLYYRIAACLFKLPPLRERREDILPLARHFMQQLEPEKEPPELDAPVQDYLLTRDYAGNVRDLRQLVLRMMYRHVGTGPVTIGDIPGDERLPGEADEPDWRNGEFGHVIRRALAHGAGLKEIGRAAQETAIQITLENEDGSVRRAARRLGVTERALQLRRAAQRQQSES